MIGQCRFRSTNQIKAFRSKETWRNWVKKTIYVSFYLISKQNSFNFPSIYSKTQATMQDLCVTATRDHNVYASFRPRIATKDAETRTKMNSAAAYFFLSLGHAKTTIFYFAFLPLCRGIVFTLSVRMGGWAGSRVGGGK